MHKIILETKPVTQYNPPSHLPLQLHPSWWAIYQSLKFVENHSHVSNRGLSDRTCPEHQKFLPHWVSRRSRNDHSVWGQWCEKLETYSVPKNKENKKKGNTTNIILKYYKKLVDKKNRQHHFKLVIIITCTCTINSQNSNGMYIN